MKKNFETRMPRVMIWVLAIIGVFAVALFFMPLRIAFSMAGLEGSRFSAQSVSGTIWNGRIEQARLGRFALGDLDAGVQFFPLLTGNMKLDLDRPATTGDSGLTATISKQGQALQVENATTNVSIGRELAPLPASNIELTDVSAAFANGRCQSAGGKVRVSLDANIPGLDLQQGLLGNAKCVDGVLVLPLVSGSGMEELTLKLEGNGFYTARLFLSGNSGDWTLILPTLGFVQVSGGYAIKIAGQLGQNNTQK